MTDSYQPIIVTKSDERVFLRLIKILATISLFYVLSISLHVYNTYIISPIHYNFKFPLFITGCHSLLHFLLATVLSMCCCFQERKQNLPPLPGEEDQQQQQIERKKLSWQDYFSLYTPCGIAGGLDIGLSVFSLKLITLSFYTMVKSSTPIFVLCFAFLFRLERANVRLISAMTLIGIGVLMTAWTDSKFEMEGFLIVILASAMAGLRWSLIQVLLESLPVRSGPLQTLKYLTPIVACTLFTCSLIFEGLSNIFNSPFFATFDATMESIGIITFGALIAFLLIFTEFYLVTITSVVTLAVAGIFKEIMTIAVSVIVFGDQLQPINIAGLVVSLLGIVFYNYTRYLKYRVKYTFDGPADTFMSNTPPTPTDGGKAHASQEFGTGAHVMFEAGIKELEVENPKEVRVFISSPTRVSMTSTQLSPYFSTRNRRESEFTTKSVNNI